MSEDFNKAQIVTTQIRVEGAAALKDGQTAVFEFSRNDEKRQGFVLCVDGQLVAFQNLCPHWNVDLDMGQRDFFSPRLGKIFCRNHGALFEPQSGKCVAGPCIGQSLERFELELDGSDVLVVVPVTPISP